MDLLDKIAPLLDQVALNIGLMKKGDTYYMTLLPVGSAEGVDPQAFSVLSPIILSGSIEELKGATFEQGFAVLQEGAKSIANATQFLVEAKALEDAAAKKKEVKKTPVTSTATSTKGADKDPVKPSPTSTKPEMSKSKLNALVALCMTGYNGVNKVREEMKKWTISDEFNAELLKACQENENKGKPGTQSSLL